MVRSEAFDDSKDNSGENNNPELVNRVYTIKPQNRPDKSNSNPADLPGNKAINDMLPGTKLKVDHNQMKDHPAEVAEGVDHMIIVKWDTTSTKFGYDANNQLMTTTMVYGSHPATIQCYLTANEAQRRSKDSDAKSDWYDVPHGREGKTGVKLSEYTHHLYFESSNTYIFKRVLNDEATELSLGKESARGLFTNSGTFITYDADRDVASIRNLKDLNNPQDNLVCKAKNVLIVPHYSAAKNGIPIKINGQKVCDMFEEFSPDGKILNTWIRDGKTNNFFRIDYSGKEPTIIKLFQVNISENGLVYSDKPITKPNNDNIKIAKRPEAPPEPPIERRPPIPPPPPLKTIQQATTQISPSSKIAKDLTAEKTHSTSPISALASEYADTLMTLSSSKSDKTGSSSVSLVKVQKKVIDSTQSIETPRANLPAGVFAEQKSQWFEKKDIPKNLQLADEQTGVHISRIQIIPYPTGEMIVGYNDKNEQVLIKSGDSLYINPNDSERSALGQPQGKSGWYLKESNRIRKTRDDNYGVCVDRSFITRDKDDPSKGYAYMPDGQIIKGKFNAVGALIENDADGSIKSLRRTDHSLLTLHYAKENNASTLNSFEETNAVGQKMAWTKIANTANDFAYKDAQGNEHIRKNVVIAMNGNLSYIDEKDILKDGPITTIVRSNGIELKSGINLPKYTFDDLGRFARIEPSPEAIKTGSRIREFVYSNNLNEDIAKVLSQNPSAYPMLPGLTFAHERIGNTEQWNCVCYKDTWDTNSNQWYRQYYTNPNGGAWPALQGQVNLDKYGNYSHQDFIVQDGIVRPIVRTWHADGNVTAHYI